MRPVGWGGRAGMGDEKKQVFAAFTGGVVG